MPLAGRSCIVDSARPAWAQALALAGASVVVVGPEAGAVAAGLPGRSMVFAGDPEKAADLLALAEMMDECWNEDPR